MVQNNDWLLYPFMIFFGCDCPIHFSSLSPFRLYLLQTFPVHVEEEHPGSTWSLLKKKNISFTLCFLPSSPFCEDLNLVNLKAFEVSCQKFFYNIAQRVALLPTSSTLLSCYSSCLAWHKLLVAPRISPEALFRCCISPFIYILYICIYFFFNSTWVAPTTFMFNLYQSL